MWTVDPELDLSILTPAEQLWLVVLAIEENGAPPEYIGAVRQLSLKGRFNRSSTHRPLELRLEGKGRDCHSRERLLHPGPWRSPRLEDRQPRLPRLGSGSRGYTLCAIESRS